MNSSPRETRYERGFKKVAVGAFILLLMSSQQWVFQWLNYVDLTLR
jgi:hypothetical protein